MPYTTNPFYISTSIAYVNGTPHVGFAMESIQADVLARWARKNGRETFFCTGTDEHGEKIQKTAEAQNTTPQAICDANSLAFRQLGQALSLSNDFFIRTSDKTVHWGSVQMLWKKLQEKGDIQKKSYTAKYCYGCEAFLTEKDLDEHGNCPHHLRAPEEISEENYFFTLSKYSEQIAELIESKQLEIIPHFRANEILQVAKAGFFDVSFSRPSKKLPWGIPVPGDDSQTMYVWCDALTNYISALDYEHTSQNFQKFWNGGEVVHVVGKDIVRFHAGIWIGMLLSAGIKIPNKIVVHGFLTSEGHKMSKSLGNVVDPFDEVKKYGTDALRYFLIREVPLGNDADFSRKRFEEIYQAHLANGLGNLTSRIIKLCEKAHISTPSTTPLDIVQEATITLYEKMDQYLLHEALASIFQVVEYCDVQLTSQKPWEHLEKNETKIFLKTMLQCLVWIADHISVFLPNTAKTMLQQIQSMRVENVLFPRIDQLHLPPIGNNDHVQAPKIPEFSFAVDPSLGIETAWAVLENVSVKKTPKGLQKYCKHIAEEFLKNGGSANFEWQQKIQSQKQITKNLGFDAELFTPSPVGLAKLVEKNGKLPNVNTIVDLYNAISLKHGVSAGAHDIMVLGMTFGIQKTNGNEHFVPMKGKEAFSVSEMPIQTHEYAFKNDDTIFCRFDSAQCEETKISEGNKNIFIYFQAPKEHAHWAKKAVEEFLEKAKEFGLV